ncbi:MAG: hypothetical protein M3044_00735 [Thermoproteota archaeon]|nr:hypothetical protein [Thermoproteota archaeon]
MEFELTDEIKILGVSKVLVTGGKLSTIYVYNGKACAQCHYYKNQLENTLTALKAALISNGQFGDEKTIDKIILLLSEIWIKSEESKRQSSGNGKDGKEKKKRPEYLAYKYSNRKKGDLHEAIILGGKPAFLVFSYDAKNIAKTFASCEYILEETRIIIPPDLESYPYEPYEFENMNEILGYMERARNETVDSLYNQSKKIAQDYNDQNKNKVNLLAIDINWSYFQDKFPTTHYDIVLGSNGSGKSSYGDTYTSTGYRVVNLTDPNAANINRILGTIEPGQCTIVSDETGQINEHPDLMAILKTGYSINKKISKINDYSRKPEFFFPYCYKMIIAEKMPNLKDAKGVHDRSFTFTAFKGRPKYDIKETLEPQGDPARQERLDSLNDFRKLMLVYRLLHFKDRIEDIDVGVEGREKELSKPIIQLFYKTHAQKEVETTLQHWLNQRTERKNTALEPVVHPTVVRLVNQNGKEVYVRDIWENITIGIDSLSGPPPDPKKPNEFQSEDYGTIYRNQISNILENVFGGKPKHNRDGNSYTFDKEELARVGKAYGIPTNIQTKLMEPEPEKCEDCEGDEGIREEVGDKMNEYDDNLQGKNDEKDTKKGNSPSVETSQPSRLHKHKPYRIKNDLWGCTNCMFKGDRFDLNDTNCTGKENNRN